MEIGDWKNSPEQRDLIVNYKINIKVIKIYN